MTDSIRFEKVTKRYGDLVAVDTLDLEIGKGEFFTLLGPSGCGKTTTLRLINGLESADDGHIYLGGKRLNDMPAYRRPVNTVFQNYALFPHLNIYDNVAYGLRIKGVARREIRSRVMEMLELVDMADKKRCFSNEISGGQKQRIALARALVNRPDVLLFDEPLGALDAKLRRDMQLELKHMHDNLGITFVYVTHDQEEAIVMSDRIAVMNSGRIEQLGTPEDIFDSPNSYFVAEFIGAKNLIPGRLTRQNGSFYVELEGGGRLRIADPPSFESQNLTMTVRPQKIWLRNQVEDLPQMDNVLKGTMKETIYLGTFIRQIVKINPHVVLEVESLPDFLPYDYRTLRPGHDVFLHLPPEAIIVYPRK
jgi:spermidine/putrescine transport system ATP-binding protein